MILVDRDIKQNSMDCRHSEWWIIMMKDMNGSYFEYDNGKENSIEYW